MPVTLSTIAGEVSIARTDFAFAFSRPSTPGSLRRCRQRDFGRPTDVRCRPAASLDRQDDTAPPQPGGNRQANNALYRIVITRTSSDERTRTYVARRRAEGKSTGEIVRILKRYVAREVFRHLQPASA